MTTNNKKCFTLTCKAGYAEGLAMGKEYKAKLTLVNKNKSDATFEVQVNPDQKTERAAPREEIARTPIWLCTEKDGNLLIKSQKLIAETTADKITAQCKELHTQLDLLYAGIMARQCTALAKLTA